MTLGAFRTRLWYAARRKGLHMDRDLTDNYATAERTKHMLTRVAPYLYLTPEDVETYQHHVKLERYGDGERVQKIGHGSGWPAHHRLGRRAVERSGARGRAVPDRPAQEG